MRQAKVRARNPGWRWQRLFLVCSVLPALLALNSCGGGSTTPPAAPSVFIIGAATSVTVNGTVQFTPTVNNLSSTLVTWEAGGVAGGNSTFGTIDVNGLYKAPATVPTNNIVTITALAVAETSITGTATITILPATQINSVVCTPNSQPNLTVASGGSLACLAETSDGTAVSSFWQVNAVQGGSQADGFISQFGNYLAPLIPPPTGTVMITAVSQADSTQTKSVAVNVTFGNKVLQGPYAFSTSGRVISASAFFARAGSFTADGNGGLIGGTEDTNHVGGPAAQFNFTGNYSVGPDGRGTMQFCEVNFGINAPLCTPAAATAFFRIVVSSGQLTQIIEFSEPNMLSALRTASGEMDSQDTSVFNAGGLVNAYSFNFYGQSSAAAPQSVVGEFDSNGSGIINAGNSTTPGEMDINAGGAQLLNSTAYSILANGRGTATLSTAGGSFAFSFYMVSSSRAKFIETDSLAVLSGDAFKQQTSPLNPCSWGNNALNNALVFETGGTGSNGGIGDLVSFTASGGIFTAGSGSIDQNSGGAVSPLASGLNGSYAIDTCGRGILSVNTHSYVFYLISTNSAVIQETTTGVVAHGLLVQPQGGPFANASFQGSYAVNLSGVNAAGLLGQEEDLLGQLTADGAGNVSAGSFDINSFGATQTGLPATGTYTGVTANGRTTVAINNSTLNFVLYIVSPTQIFVLDTDTTDVGIGLLNKQF